MNLLDENIGFGEKNKNYDKNDRKDTYPEYISFKISDIDEIAIYKLWNDQSQTEVFPHLYLHHNFCGGSIYSRDLKEYKLLVCQQCYLRIVLPNYIETVSDLRKHFKEFNVENKINSRSEIIDL